MIQTKTDSHNDKKILRLADVLNITGWSRAALYRELERGFPKPINLGKTRCIGWPIEVINSWYEEQLTKSKEINAPIS